MDTRLYVPAAILLGSVIIATGVFLGIRGRKSEASGAAVPAPAESAALAIRSATSSTGGGAPQTSPAPPGLSPPATTPQRLAAVRAAVLGEKPRFVSACWTPHPGSGRPASIHLTFNVAFDATGREVGRGISESRDGTWAPSVTCLRRLPLDLTIPPGEPVNTEVALTLP